MDTRLDSDNPAFRWYATLCFLNFMVSLNLQLIFLALASKMYSSLRFVVQFSKFLIWHNGPPSLLAVASSSFWKYVSSEPFPHTVTSLWPCAHERIFSPRRSKQITRARPALNLMCLGITVTQQVHSVSPMSDKCTKECPLQHHNHCVFISKTFNRNVSRLNCSFCQCSCDFTS
jgi:hypothetical protein